MDPALLALLDILKTQGISTFLLCALGYWAWKRGDRVLDRFEKHLDVMDAMAPDVAAIKRDGCARLGNPSPPPAGPGPAPAPFRPVVTQ